MFGKLKCYFNKHEWVYGTFTFLNSGPLLDDRSKGRKCIGHCKVRETEFDIMQNGELIGKGYTREYKRKKYVKTIN